MSTNNLTNRATGQTILETFWNEIHQALNSDFVGRNASGVPTAGQNLGTVALPWGTLRTDSMILGGSSVDPSLLTSPQNRVISGKTRSSSNQPAYIVPTGGAASFLIDGTPTNLVVDINGSAVTVNTDITKSSLTTAPGSQNTALVNDTDAADQLDTRMWGEDFHYKKITIDNVGTNISSLVGKFASFKISNGGDTEYFYAFVESATVLSKCHRGFFYDSAIAPINRIFFSNNDTITLMNTAYIFIENDSTTVDVSYNNPVWSFTSPSAPVTGDYWYDLLNNLWKRYDGASFQIINRTYIGMALIDTANCVAARCADVYAAYSPVNTIDLEVKTSEIVQGKSVSQKASVSGRMIDFGLSLPIWNITTDLAAAADMYNSTEQASRQYYLYLKDTGDTVISDIQPYFRYDLFGRYHPHNPWRCVGMAFNDLSSDIVQAGGFYGTTEVVYNTPNGLGSGGYARLYDVLESSNGADAVGILDAVKGTKIMIFEPAIYDFYLNDVSSIGNCNIGVEKNKSYVDQLSTVTSNDQTLSFNTAPVNHLPNASVCPRLLLGEFVMPMSSSSGPPNGTDYFYKFRTSLVKRLFPY